MAVERDSAAVKRNGTAVKRNSATVKRVGTAVERSRRGEDTGGGRGQGHGRGHGTRTEDKERGQGQRTRTEDKDRGHGDSVNKLLRTDLRRAMAPIIYRYSSQRPQANTQPYSDAFHVSSCDPSFPHSVLHAIPHSRTPSFMRSRIPALRPSCDPAYAILHSRILPWRYVPPPPWSGAATCGSACDLAWSGGM